ncbi:POK9 protein, partial [Cettia cetti]|nr:POK9 protein [Cettia cetti]
QYQCLQKVGKLQELHEQQRLRGDTSSNCNALRNQLQPATSGSLGLDLAASVDITLMTMQHYKIPTGIKGPVMINGQTFGGLLAGRSSASAMGLLVLLGCIDADYEGEIMIMVQTSYPPVKISQCQRLAQLIPLPQLTKGLTPLKQNPRGQGGFGSTGGLTLLTIDLSNRPKKRCRLSFQGQDIALTELLDTGADTCIISPTHWPSNWPIQSSTTTVTGIGGMTLANRTPILIVEIEGRQTSASFSIAPLLPMVECLIGWDVLSQLGLML